MMSRKHQDILTKNRLLLIRNLKVTEFLLADLRADYTITEEMQQEIEAERTESKKAGALLDILIRRGDKAFHRFIQALVDSFQDQLALALDRSTTQDYIAKNPSRRVDRPPTAAPSFRLDYNSGLNGSNQVVMMVPMEMASVMMSVASQSFSQPAVNELQYSHSGAVVTQPTHPTQPTQPIQPSDKCQGYSGMSNLLGTTNQAEDEAIIAEINGSKATAVMAIGIKAATNLHLANDPKVYPMCKLPRGRAIIINNRYFVSKLCCRDGAQYDTVNLKELFTALSFTVVIKEDLPAEDIKRFLKAESQHQDHKKAEMFVLFLLSHGNEGNIYGIDGQSLSIENDIAALFCPENCPVLSGKPKIFFIQACQGYLARRYATDSDKWMPSKEEENLQEKLLKLKLEDDEGFVPGYNKKSDMVMAYATVKGDLAWRRSDLGSWFVRCIVSVFSRQAHKEHLLDMLTEANFLLSKLETSPAEGRSHQLAEKTDTLIKKLYFFPGAAAVKD